MPFKLHDTVRLISSPETIGPVVGMVGFIDDIINEDYYSFSAVEEYNNEYRVVGTGGIPSIHMVADNSEELVDAVNSILFERKANYDKIMASVHLKNIIENGEIDEEDE